MKSRPARPSRELVYEFAPFAVWAQGKDSFVATLEPCGIGTDPEPIPLRSFTRQEAAEQFVQSIVMKTGREWARRARRKASDDPGQGGTDDGM